MNPTLHPTNQNIDRVNNYLTKKINENKDVIEYKTQSGAYKNLVSFIDGLCSLIKGTALKYPLRKHEMTNEIFKMFSRFCDELGECCDKTDLKQGLSAGGARFGLAAYRDWYDQMDSLSRTFIENLSNKIDQQYKEELIQYLRDSFGNRMRIDYGTGHELNFMIFVIGLCNLARLTAIDSKPEDQLLTPDLVRSLVEQYGWDVHLLFAKKYIKLSRKIQSRFRLEPAGSRGVYNIDDYQFLPFLFGAAQLAGTKAVGVSDFYNEEQVDMFRDEYIFFEAVSFILTNKRGPFNEHSYTLWNFSGLGSWDLMYRRIRSKFDDDVLTPFPIVQHLLFGKYIFPWKLP